MIRSQKGEYIKMENMRMLLKTRFMFSMIFVFLIFGVAEAVILRLVVFESFTQLEQNEAIRDIERVDHSINREVHHLGLLCHDWASWDEMYDFVSNGNNDFVHSNLLLNSFKANNCNLIYVIDRSMNLIWGNIYDLDTGESLKLEKFSVRNSFGADDPFKFNFSSRSTESLHKRGIIQTEKGAMLIVSRPIKKSTDLGTPNGVLVMGRFLGRKTINDLVDQTKVNFDVIYPINKDSYQNMRALYVTADNQTNKYYMQNDNGKIRVIKEFMGIGNTPVFQIEIILPRSITEKGLQTINFTACYVIASTLTILFVFGFILRKNVFSPLDRMSRHMQKIENEGDFSLRLKIRRKDEIGILGSVFDKMIDKIETQTIELLKANRKLQDLSSTDELTRISNRRIFNQHFSSEWIRMKRENKPISLIMCDIDFFKQYNDLYGHQAGDECLIKVADIMRGNVSRAGDLVARYGGEEFAIVLSDTSAGGAAQVVRKIISELQKQHIPHDASKASGFVSMSFGIASVVPSDDFTFEKVVKMADKALYNAKANGRNRYEIFNTKNEEGH